MSSAVNDVVGTVARLRPSRRQPPTVEQLDADLNTFYELVTAACSTPRPMTSFAVLTVRRPVAVVRGARAIASLPRHRLDPGEGTKLRRRLDHHRGPFPTGRWAVAVRMLPGDAAELVKGRSRQAWRTNLAHATRAGISCRHLDDLCDQRPAILELIRARGWPPSWEEFLEREHGVREGFGDHFVATDAAGAVLAVAVVEVTGPVAFLVWQESIHTTASSWARYALQLEVMRWLVDRSVGQLVTGSTLGLSPGLRYFQRRLGFELYNVGWG